MENPFNDNELEQFLQNETRQHRMYPSDKVWRNIHKEIHPKKSWPALTFFSLFVIVALTVLTILNNHPAQPFDKVATVEQPKPQNLIASSKKMVEYKALLFPNNINTEALALLRQKEKMEELKAFENLLATENPSAAIVPNTNNEKVLVYQPSMENVSKPDGHSEKIIASNDRNIESGIRKRLNKSYPALIVDVVASAEGQTKATEGTAIAKNQKLAVIANAKTVSNSMFKKPIDDSPEMEEYTYGANGLPKLIARNKESKLDFQFYLAPSISYRKLVDDKERNSYQRSASPANVPTALNYTVNVNDVVRHKPAMGTEVGLGVMYKLNKRLKLKTGVQLNVRQYYIDGFSTSTGLATIAIVSNNKLDTVTQYSSFSNTNGYSESQLDNRLFQVSLPVGLQWDFFQGRRLGFSIGGSLQPTLTLNKNLYIISTDYKAYTDGTPFLRRWNINSSAELDITYKVGNVKWSLGPQIRYQHLPTYSDKYPIKEYRLDYGLKIGFTRSF
jgi:hypothetical protein